MSESNSNINSLPRKWESLIPVLAALAVYVYTLPPSISGEDSGELVAAAYTLGIPHPTGYPLWTMLAHLFIKLIPFGDIAWRATLLSAVFGAITVGIVHRFIIDLTQNRWAAMAGALALAYSREFWEQSVIAEVYTLNAFFVVICLYLAYRYHLAPENTKLAYALVFLFSLSLSNHSTMFLIGPILALSILKSNPATIRTPRIIITFNLLFLLGLSVHLYLPIRSLANPAMDWGNPENWSNFWSVITREQYQNIITGSPRSLSRFAWQCGVFAKQYAWEFTPWVGWIPIAGFIIMVRNKSTRYTAIILGATLTTITLAAILVPNFGPTYHEIWLNSTYYIPVYVISAIFMGVAINAITKRFHPPIFIQGITLFQIIISPLLIHFQHNNMRDYHFTRDYAYNLLGTMAPDAIYFGSGDHTIFPMVYLQVVEGLRPDVTMANRYGYPDTDLLAQLPDPPESFPPTEDEEERLFAWLMENSVRPIYSVVERPPGKRTAVREGLVYKYVTDSQAVDINSPWNSYQWNTISPRDAWKDWTSSLIVYEYHYAKADWLAQVDHNDDVLLLLIEAQMLTRGDPGGMNNLGVLYARHGYLNESQDVFELILNKDPNYMSTLLNFSKVRLKQYRPHDALELAERALAIQPDSQPAQRLKEKALRRISPTQDSEN